MDKYMTSDNKRLSNLMKNTQKTGKLFKMEASFRSLVIIFIFVKISDSKRLRGDFGLLYWVRFELTLIRKKLNIFKHHMLWNLNNNSMYLNCVDKLLVLCDEG